ARSLFTFWAIFLFSAANAQPPVNALRYFVVPRARLQVRTRVNCKKVVKKRSCATGGPSRPGGILKKQRPPATA
ncbi:MAG: hypothetical protein ACLFWB_12245, partial [Armatimonadota bacterium]